MNDQLYIGKHKPVIGRFEPIKNIDRYYVNKPKGGLWTSSYCEEANTSAWVDWCKKENFVDAHALNWFILKPRQDAKILTIDTYADLEHAAQRYKLAQHFYLTGFTTALDFERISKEYDGIRLTSRGDAETHFSEPENLYAWDCESTVWFKWCFDEVVEIHNYSEETHG